jgi:PGF-CTERM protein
VLLFKTGIADLTGISVNDPMISLPEPTGDDNDPGVLNPGETWVYDAIYTLTPEDVENGHIDNTATVSSNELPDESSNVDTPVDQNADLSIYKSFTGIDEAGDHMIDSSGDVINYQIAVKNNGNVDLHNVHVVDSLIDDLSGPTGNSIDPEVLNPGETWIYTGDYTVTTADIESNGGGSGFITNTATVSCTGHPDESSSIMMPIITGVNTPIDTNPGDNTSAKVNPVADFSASVTSGYAPLSVQFTDKSQNAETWNWDFNGDGVVDSSAQNPPAYTYNTPGTYVAKLTVTNANGPASSTATINVLQTTSSSGGGGGGGSIGSANVVSSSSGSTANASVTPTETNTPGLEQTSTPTNVQTPEPTATSTPAKQSKKTPGFEIVTGVTALLGAIYLYRRR